MANQVHGAAAFELFHFRVEPGADFLRLHQRGQLVVEILQLAPARGIDRTDNTSRQNLEARSGEAVFAAKLVREQDDGAAVGPGLRAGKQRVKAKLVEGAPDGLGDRLTPVLMVRTAIEAVKGAGTKTDGAGICRNRLKRGAWLRYAPLVRKTTNELTTTRHFDFA